jgi:hypothetical protein
MGLLCAAALGAQELRIGTIEGMAAYGPLVAKGAVMVPARIASTDFCAVATDPGVKVANPNDLRKYNVGIVKDHPGHVAITRGMTVTETAGDAEEF